MTSASERLHAALPAPGEPFALLSRPGAGRDDVEVLRGPVRAVPCLDGLDLDATVERGGAALVLLPYRQVRERGFDSPDDGEPLLAMTVESRVLLPLADAFEALPDRVPEVTGLGFDVDDRAYAAEVRRIVREEIASGEGANFVLARSLRGRFTRFGAPAALAAFRRLLAAESGAYWTFLVFTGERYLVGGTPEQHVRVEGDGLRMNPISGTYRYPDGDGRPGAASAEHTDGLLRFLDDPKETDELYMVVDEELKMMAALCDRDIEVTGPALRRMSRLAHTEYFLSGHCARPLSEVLRRTMFAPTVTGSPLENACRAIARHEPAGRGYYSGVIALAESRDGVRALDSAIMIRTADIGADGALRITAGSTIVRHSHPRAEAEETSAKVAGLLRAIAAGTVPERGPTAGGLPRSIRRRVADALRRRNLGVSGFWRTGSAPRPDRLDAHVRMVGAEDDFTAMLAYQLRSVGCRVSTHPWREAEAALAAPALPGEVLLLGPGPGDPRDESDPRIARLRAVADGALRTGRPLVAVCLGHQVVCGLLGLPLSRLDEPNQGRRIRVRLGGRDRWAGFYNSFAAHSTEDEVPGRGATPVRVLRDPDGHVLGLRGAGLATVQFHAESFLTEDGPRILHGLVAGVLARPHNGRSGDGDRNEHNTRERLGGRV